MTTNDYIQRLKEKDNLIRLKQFVGLAASTIHVQMSNRIFDKGENTENKPIGTYNDSNELYVNPKTSPKKFQTKGKSGQTKFANGKPHKTAYFDSYKSYRASQNRETNFVDLTLWGDLRNNFKSGLTESNGKWIVTVRDNNAKKIDGNETRYGEIFTATEEEKENFKKLINNEIIEILKK